MGELKDYGGEFRSDLKMEDFSSAALANLWLATSRLYAGLDGMWYSLIRERYGAAVASELDAEIWKRVTPIEVGRVRRVMNITGSDVASVFKFIQTDPGSGGVFPEFVCDLRNDKVGVLTIKRCLGLEYYERHGDRELQKHACEVLDVEGFADAAHLFNPKIKVTPLKLPPRKSPDDIACQWEFRLED